MPTYEYRCSAGHQYEKREGFDAPARQECQVCSKPADRLLFAPPIVFKGSGFYKTDNRGASSGVTDSGAAASTPSTNGDHGHSHGPDGSHVPAADSTSTESPAAS